MSTANWDGNAGLIFNIYPYYRTSSTHVVDFTNYPENPVVEATPTPFLSRDEYFEDFEQLASIGKWKDAFAVLLYMIPPAEESQCLVSYEQTLFVAWKNHYLPGIREVVHAHKKAKRNFTKWVNRTVANTTKDWPHLRASKHPNLLAIL